MIEKVKQLEQHGVKVIFYNNNLIMVLSEYGRNNKFYDEIIFLDKTDNIKHFLGY